MNLINKKLPIICIFDHKSPKAVLTIQDLKTEIYEKLDTLYPVDMYQRLHYR